MANLNIEMHDELEDDNLDELFTSVEEWNQEQELILKSNQINENENPPTNINLAILDWRFGLQTFRPLQWKVISSIINNRRDNCVVMAPGHGRSLCFQYPSLYLGGLTIVITPSIAYIENKVLSAWISHIPACSLEGREPINEEILDFILRGEYNIIYATPGFCITAYGQGLLRLIHNHVRLHLIVIEEAHCVSTWGHNYHFHYQELRLIKNILPQVPILAFSTVATPKVRRDIINYFNLRNPQVLCSGFDRPNLYFCVYFKGNNGILLDLQKAMVLENNRLRFSGPTIIFCQYWRIINEIVPLLRAEGIKCRAYHGGMTMLTRERIREKFLRNKTDVIVTTTRFGIGISKPDVRNVIHYGAPKNIESYYEEIGRGGRDGELCKCVIFYNSRDLDEYRRFNQLRNREQKEIMERATIQYLDCRKCRRQFILNYFEGIPRYKEPKLNCCDNCTRMLQ